MILLSFHKVGPGEYTAWYRGCNFTVTKRSTEWLTGFNGSVIARSQSQGAAVDSAHDYAAELKASGFRWPR